VRASAKAPIGEPIYTAVGLLMGAIDGVAETLTGDRTHFHLKGGAPSNQISHHEPGK